MPEVPWWCSPALDDRVDCLFGYERKPKTDCNHEIRREADRLL